MPLKRDTSILFDCVVHAEAAYGTCLSLRDTDSRVVINCLKTTRECADLCTLMFRLKASDSSLFYRMIPLAIELCKECMFLCESMEGAVFQTCTKTCSEAIVYFREQRK